MKSKVHLTFDSNVVSNPVPLLLDRGMTLTSMSVEIRFNTSFFRTSGGT